MHRKYFLFARACLALFALVVGLHLASGKAEAAINWEANCGGPKTIYGYDPGNITNINFGSVPQGTASVSRSSQAGVHVCSTASYSSVAAAAIQATNNSVLAVSPDRLEYGSVSRGATEYQSVTFTAYPSNLSVGTHNLCLSFSGAATYSGTRHSASGSACGTITITAPTQPNGTIAVKKMIPDGNGWKVGSPATNNPVTNIGWASSGANEWSQSYAAGVYSTSTNAPPSGWHFVKTTATYGGSCGSHSGTETSPATSYDVRVCSNQTVVVRFHYAPDEIPNEPNGTIAVKKMIPDGNGWKVGSPAINNPTTYIGWASSGANEWSQSYAPGVYSTSTLAPPSGWHFVKTTATYGGSCGSHSGTETSASMAHPVRVCSNQTVVVRFHYAPDTGSQTVSCNAFSANPQSLSNPGNTTLSWQTSGGASWSINNGVGSVGSANGTKQVYVANTITYTLTVTGANGSDTCSTIVTVTPTLDPTNGPWLQSKWGNTTAIREITSNKAGDRGSRPVAATEKEAQYVVMAYIVNNFCSTKGYNFGAGSGGGCTYPVGYRVNPSIYRSGDLGGPDDPIIANLRKILANSATNDTSCNAQKPYFVVPNLTAVLGSPAVSFGATASCAKVGTLTSATLSSHTFSQGRATIFVDGNLTITADNVVNYGGSYLSPNEVPNVGLIVKGDITIDPAVKNLDISMYATGKIKTCTTYPNPNCNTQLKVRGIMAAAGGFELGRNLYGASPSELIVGSGLIEAFPPPGFIDVSSNKVVGVKYLSTESNPRF